MLKQRLIFGTIMIAALIVVFQLDNMLDRVDLAGTVWQRVFLGRDYLPRGLLMLGLFLVLIVLGSREICAIARAKDIHADAFTVVGSSRVDLQACKLEYSIVSPK